MLTKEEYDTLIEVQNLLEQIEKLKDVPDAFRVLGVTFPRYRNLSKRFDKLVSKLMDQKYGD